MKNKKTIWKPFTVWDYELEVCELNRESKNGWQLVHGGLFHREYERDQSVVYRYQLDYNNKDNDVYYEMFKEQKWEYVNSTINGWNYFRKPYDETMDESEYLIYTDMDSKKKMHSKFLNVMLILFLAVILANFQHLYSFIETPKIATSGVLLFYGIYIFMFIKAKVGLSRVERGIVPKRRSKIELYLLLLIFSLFFIFSEIDMNFQTQVNSQMEETKEEVEYKFFYESTFPDLYYFEIHTEDEQLVTLIIENEEGETVYQKENFGNEDNKAKVFLRSGQYQCIIKAQSNINYTLHIQ